MMRAILHTNDTACVCASAPRRNVSLIFDCCALIPSSVGHSKYSGAKAALSIGTQFYPR